MKNQPVTEMHNPAITAFLCLVFALPWSDGSPGQILTISFMFLIFTIAVLWFYRQSPFPVLAYLKSRHRIALLLFCGWLISSSISLLLVLNTEISLLHKSLACYRHFSLLLFVFLTFALARFCLINRLSHIRIFTALTGGMVLLLFLYLLIYFFGPTPNANIWALYPPLGSHIRNIGNVAAVTSVVTVLMFINRLTRSNIGQILLLFSSLATWSFLVWNGGRSSIAVAVITSIFIILFSMYFAKASIQRCLLISSIIIGGFFIGEQLSVFSWNGLQRAAHIAEVSAAGNDNIANDQFTSGRMTMWKRSLNAVKKSPWFGLGPYGYYFIPDKTYDDQPHNFIVQFLVEWGIIGTTFMLGLLSYCATYGLKQLPAAFRERDFSYISAASVVLLLTLDGLTAGTYFKLQPMLCLSIAFAVFPFGHRHYIAKIPE